MNEQRIREIAEESSYHAENSVDYYSGIVDGLTWEAKILKARDLKFAELIIQECCDVLQTETIRNDGYGYNQGFFHKKIKEHIGVE